MSKKGVTRSGIWKCIGLGCITELISAICLALVASICIQNEYLNINGGRYVILGIHTVSVLLGTFLCFRMINESKILAAGCAAIGYYILFLGIGVAVFDRIGQGMIRCFLACFVGFFLGVVLCNLDKKKIKGAKRRKAVR